MCDLSGGTRTLQMTKFASRELYAVPSVRVKSEVYFGLNPEFTPDCITGA